MFIIIQVTNTYQAIVISDGRETYAVFTYNCDDLNWIGEEENYASVGYNVPSTTSTFASFANYALSRTSEVGRVACNHTSFNRPWTNHIYRIGIALSKDQIARSVCLARVANDETTFPVRTETLFEDPALLPQDLSFSDCPCSIQQARRDPSFIFVDEIGSLGDLTCFFSRFTSVYNGVYLLNRCCYDTRFVKTCTHVLILIFNILQELFDIPWFGWSWKHSNSVQWIAKSFWVH